MNEIMSVTLDNGLKVLLQKIPYIRTISTGIWIKQGSKNETSKNNGISHIVEHMVLNKNSHQLLKNILK